MTDSLKPPASRAARRGPAKRERLVGAARELFHEQGVEKTTIADISQRAKVLPGNIYYYFKTKDDVIEAVIGSLARDLRELITQIEQRHRTPQSRLKALAAALAGHGDSLARYGCPFGTLCSELDKRADGPRASSPELMKIPVDWAEEQFRSIGRPDARDLAVEFIAAYQGTALLANTFDDPKLMASTVRRLARWVDTLSSDRPADEPGSG
jgi:AcrR family transcriptional regulator